MKLALVFLLSSAGFLVGALALPAVPELFFVAGGLGLLGVLLLLRASVGRRRRQRIVVDGSNVMHWADGNPRIEVLRDVVRHIESLGLEPGVIFDANAGYLVSGRYLHDGAFARMLKLPRDHVMVAAKGTPADVLILKAAKVHGARVVTNDRYRDWADRFPEIREPGFLVRGGYRNRRPWLNLADPAAEKRTAPDDAAVR
ncbi:MAG: hypothetical protein AAF844_15800 [Pseudomonadota bacterium]